MGVPAVATSRRRRPASLLALVTMLASSPGALWPSGGGGGSGLARAEVFAGTVTASSCRVDIAQFTFLPQSSFGSETPSVEASVVRAGVCRIKRAFNESTDQVLDLEDITEELQAQALQDDAAAIEACMAASDVYLAVLATESYDPEIPCAAFQDGLSEATDGSVLVERLEFQPQEIRLVFEVEDINPDTGRVEAMHTGGGGPDNAYLYYFTAAAELNLVATSEGTNRHAFVSLVASSCPAFDPDNIHRAVSASEISEKVYCHGNLEGVGYHIKLVNPVAGATGVDGVSPLSQGFFYHLSVGDQVETVLSIVLMVLWVAVGAVALSVMASLRKRDKMHVTVKLLMTSIFLSVLASAAYLATYMMLQSMGIRNLIVFCVGAYLNSFSAAGLNLMILLLMKGWTVVRRKLTGHSRVQVAVAATLYFLLRVIENSAGLNEVINPDGSLALYRTALPVSWAVHIYELLLFFWILRSYCTTLNNFNKKKAFYAKFISLCGVALLAPVVTFFVTVGLNDGRGSSTAEPDYNWIVQQITLFAFSLVMVLLYNPTATCQMGFPFHKRTSDMRDESDPELLVSPSAVLTIFNEVQRIVQRFALLQDYGSELRVSVELCEAGEADADEEDTDLYDMLDKEDDNNFGSGSTRAKRRRKQKQSRPMQRTSSTESDNGGGVELTTMGGGGGGFGGGD